MFTICTPMSEDKSCLAAGRSGTVILAKVPPPAFFVSLPGLTHTQPSSRWGGGEGAKVT